jgi:hypothetical protein
MFDAQVETMQNPVQTEDYIVISGKHTFPTQFAAVTRKLREQGLYGIGGDGGAQVAKPGMVNLIPNQPSGRVDMGRRNITIR